MPDEIMPAPVAAITSQTRMHHGSTLVDPYTWLQNKADPAVIAYLEAENAYAHAQLQHTEALQEELFHELRSRIKEDDSTAPQPCGDYFYYWRTEKGKQYRIFCRKRGRLDGQEEVLIDENELAAGRDYCRVFTFEPSPDHTLLAYSVDTTGAWVFDLYIKDLRTGELVTAAIPNTAWSVAWASDCRTLFYTLFDEAHRPYQVYRHTIGDLSPADPLVYHESDNAFSLEIRRTRSGAFLLLTLQSMSTSEVRYLSANHPQGDFQLIHPRQHWMEYYVEHHGDRFLIRSNEQAENFKLMEAPVASPTKSHWREVIPHRADTLIEDVRAFHDHLVVYERTQGLKQIRISAPDGRTHVHHVAFPEPVYTFQTRIGAIDLNRAFNTRVLRMLYSSLVTPESPVDYDMISGTWDVKKEQEIPSGYDPVQYETQRLHVTAPDGTSIPISLVYRTGLQRDGRNPTLLYGYGAYGYSLDPGFDAKRISLLDRGFVFAMAHVRGGSELGRAWYEQGRLVYKKNSFTDFIACAEHLVAAGYTMPDKLAILGGSAGGLLVSAVANLRPDLFKAVV
ncbi:MAG TPA: prolyl oligopeptidase family serine peptidase, partial [Herpetosiphonaceae bacterium]|nr:prolyl oligopeptidase family serine peptidase [Herpetosiphonaceae bacterium]